MSVFWGRYFRVLRFLYKFVLSVYIYSLYLYIYTFNFHNDTIVRLVCFPPTNFLCTLITNGGNKSLRTDIICAHGCLFSNLRGNIPHVRPLSSYVILAFAGSLFLLAASFAVFNNDLLKCRISQNGESILK